MAIDNLKAADITISNINEDNIPQQTAVQGERSGRSLLLQITNGGIIENQAGVSVNLGWAHDTAKNADGEKLQGLDSFQVVDRSTGIFRFDYPSNMMIPGRITAVIQLVGPSSDTRSKPFKIKIEGSPFDDEAAESDNSFTALQEALTETVKFDNRIEDLEVNKADNNSVWSLSNMGQDVKEAMTGGSVAVVGPDVVDNINVKNNAVSEQKTTFFDLSSNLFNYLDVNILKGQGFSGTTGTIVEAAQYNISGWIDVQSNQRIFLSSNGIEVARTDLYKIAFYKNAGEWVSTSFYQTGGIVVPSGVYLMRVHYSNTTIQFQIETGRIRPYVEYKATLRKEAIDDQSITPLKTNFFKQGNLFNSIDPNILRNKGFSGITGTIVDSSLYDISGWIDYQSGKKVLIGNNGVEVTNIEYFKIAAYNEETWISTSFYQKGGVNLPETATRFRVHYDNKVSKLLIQLDSLTEYVEYTAAGLMIDPKYLPANSPTESESNLKGKQWTSYGDSLTFRNAWQPYIISATEMIHTNLGIGSTTVALVEEYESTLPSFTNENRLQAIKDSSPWILTIQGGANDAHRGVKIGDNSQFTLSLDSKDRKTFKGALSYLIEYLLIWKPELNIILMTTVQSNWAYDYTPYAEAVRDVAKYYGILLADWYEKNGVNKINIDSFTTDGLHQNAAGGKRAANTVYTKMKKLEFL